MLTAIAGPRTCKCACCGDVHWIPSPACNRPDCRTAYPNQTWGNWARELDLVGRQLTERASSSFESCAWAAVSEAMVVSANCSVRSRRSCRSRNCSFSAAASFSTVASLQVDSYVSSPSIKHVVASHSASLLARSGSQDKLLQTQPNIFVPAQPPSDYLSLSTLQHFGTICAGSSEQRHTV